MPIDILSGSVTAVDTESLRRAAALLDGAAHRLESSRQAFVRARMALWGTAVSLGAAATADSIVYLCQMEVAQLAAGLRHAADVYEFVELSMRAVLLSAGAGYEEGLWGAVARSGPGAGPDASDSELRDIQDRWAELRRENPEAFAEAEELWLEWRENFGAEGLDEWTSALPIFMIGAGSGAALTDAARRAIVAIGTGTVPRAARLSGAGDPVTIHPAKTMAVTAPASLEEVTRRIPDEDTEARVRVETYRLPDGAREHVVYIAGTQSTGMGAAGADAWDMKSNLDLYTGVRSAAYNGVVEALEHAGVQPGEALHEVGFSQGAMIAGRIALEGDHDVRSLISFGSPTDVQGGDDLLQVSVRHTDDLVPALANGGMAAAGGSSDSIVVERRYDQFQDLVDLAIPAHRSGAYAETAAHIDATGDPRAEPVHQLIASLAEAESVTATEYAVTRDTASSPLVDDPLPTDFTLGKAVGR